MTITSVTHLSVQINVRHRRKKCPVNNGAKVGINKGNVLIGLILTPFVRTNQSVIRPKIRPQHF